MLHAVAGAGFMLGCIALLISLVRVRRGTKHLDINESLMSFIGTMTLGFFGVVFMLVCGFVALS